MANFGFSSAVTTNGPIGPVTFFGRVNPPIPPCTLEEVCEKLDALTASVAVLLNSRGFRRELPSRQDLMNILIGIQTEVIDQRYEIRQLKNEKRSS